MNIPVENIVFVGLLIILLLWLLQRHYKIKLASQLKRISSEFRDQQLRNKADLNAYLVLLARLYGSELFRRSPKRYLKTVKNLEKNLKNIKNAINLEQEVALEKLTKKYFTFSDFDYCGESWPHFMIHDALDVNIDSLIETYSDIRTFRALMIITDNDWLGEPTIDPNEIKSLDQYILEVEDTHLCSSLMKADEQFNWVKENITKSENERWTWITPEFCYRYGDYCPATIDVLVYVRSTKKYGVITKFYDGDDGYTDYYGLDESLTELRDLNILNEEITSRDVKRIIKHPTYHEHLKKYDDSNFGN